MVSTRWRCARFERLIPGFGGLGAPRTLLLQGPPLQPTELGDPRTGNRFDSPTGDYGVRYFATELEGCFGETLARFRPDVALIAEIEADWQARGFMLPGDVPSDWRQRRLAVKVAIQETKGFCAGPQFLDVEAGETREELRVALADVLAYYGSDDLDVATVRGRDRRITRWISKWAHDQQGADGEAAFGGIRYLSRLDTAWECWAVFEEVELKELVKLPILANNTDLQNIARRFKLRVY